MMVSSLAPCHVFNSRYVSSDIFWPVTGDLNPTWCEGGGNPPPSSLEACSTSSRELWMLKSLCIFEEYVCLQLPRRIWLQCCLDDQEQSLFSKIVSILTLQIYSIYWDWQAHACKIREYCILIGQLLDIHPMRIRLLSGGIPPPSHQLSWEMLHTKQG